jgi:hypothetical protein
MRNPPKPFNLEALKARALADQAAREAMANREVKPAARRTQPSDGFVTELQSTPNQIRLHAGSKQSSRPQAPKSKYVAANNRPNHKWRGESKGATTVDVPARDSRWDRKPVTPISQNNVHKFRNRNA